MEAQAYKGDWYEYAINGENFITDDETAIPEDAIREETYVNKWFSRLSEPGTIDCTEWLGPNDTEYGALWELYQAHGSLESESFFSFIGEGKLILAGSLHLSGSRNELYGDAIGEGPVWLAPLGDIDLDEDPETGEVTKVDYDPNEDFDLPEAYGFELIDGDELTEHLQEILNAKRDSEYFLTVHLFCLLSDQTWSQKTVDLPREWSAKERELHAIDMTMLDFDEGHDDQPMLAMDLPALIKVGVLKEEDDWQEYQDAKND